MKKVLLPIDGSQRSLRSIEMTKQFFTPQEAEITLITIVSTPRYLQNMGDASTSEENLRSALEALVQQLPGYQVHTEVLYGGGPGSEIVQYAKAHQFDTIVITCSSRGPLRKLGSVATYIVRNANFIDIAVLREVDEKSQ